MGLQACGTLQAVGLLLVILLPSVVVVVVFFRIPEFWAGLAAAAHQIIQAVLSMQGVLELRVKEIMVVSDTEIQAHILVLVVVVGLAVSALVVKI